MEKPTTVETGSRWRANGCNCELVAAEGALADSRSIAGGPVKCPMRAGVTHHGISSRAGIHTYLGPQPPPVQSVGEVVLENCTIGVAPPTPTETPAAGLRGTIEAVKRANPTFIEGAAAANPGPEGKRVPPQGLSRDEHRNINGVAMSALERIQARKPPAPWVPSVDDFDLLPDA